MLKLALAISTLAFISSMPAMADDMMMKCDEATVMKMDKEVDAISDPSMKEMAMKDMMMAKESMKMNKMDECIAHMGKAHKNAM